MKVITLISLLFITLGFENKSIHEKLQGEWSVISWKTSRNDSFEIMKEKEMLDKPMIIVFKHDSLDIIENQKKDTYYYFIRADTIFVPEDPFGGLYKIEKLDDKNLYLFNQGNATYQTEDLQEYKLHSESKIKLKRKDIP